MILTRTRHGVDRSLEAAALTRLHGDPRVGHGPVCGRDARQQALCGGPLPAPQQHVDACSVIVAGEGRAELRLRPRFGGGGEIILAPSRPRDLDRFGALALISEGHGQGNAPIAGRRPILLTEEADPFLGRQARVEDRLLGAGAHVGAARPAVQFVQRLTQV
jgi:hypothetical protein